MKQIGSCKIYYFGGKTMSLNDLVLEFRQAIDKAKSLGALEKDCIFCRFPRGCCGDTSDLLAHYLLEHGIKTNYICGNYRNGGIEKAGNIKGFGCNRMFSAKIQRRNSN